MINTRGESEKGLKRKRKILSEYRSKSGRGVQASGEKNRQAASNRNRNRKTQTDRQTDRCTDRLTGRQIHRQTDEALS